MSAPRTFTALSGASRCTSLSRVSAKTGLPLPSIASSLSQPQTRLRHPSTQQRRLKSYTQAARDLNQKGIDEEVSKFDKALEAEREKQVKAPWHREGTQEPPVNKLRSAGAMTKGKLLTTPSRLLKLILPLTTHDRNTDRKDIEPLALLVHPQQPLSYLERLIQSEVPPITKDDGSPKIPSVSFRAMESANDEIRPRRLEKAPDINENDDPKKKKEAEEAEEAESSVAAEREKKAKEQKETLRNAKLGEGGVESYSGEGREGKGEDSRNFVRWSSSTEIGDFIRDAARAKEFEVDIEGADNLIRVAVPSFNDRTYYLRMRLRKTSKQIKNFAGIKKECDLAAHKGAQRIAMTGFGILAGWWGLVYKLTFGTELGWDTMEPVTYLVGLSTLMGGYLWFLYHNREISYRSALNISISRRQTKLYQARGFDIQKWEMLIDEGNALRKEIKAVAAEYDVDWDEVKDEHDVEVLQALKQERQKENGGKDKDDDDNKIEEVKSTADKEDKKKGDKKKE